MTLDEAYEILEKYYLVLYLDYKIDSTNRIIDVDIIRKIKLESVLFNFPKLTRANKDFLMELLSADIGESVEKAIRFVI